MAGIAFGPSDLSANGAAPSQPGANAPGQRRKNTKRAVGPTYHPRRKNRAFSPLACRRTCSLGVAQGWDGTGLWPSGILISRVASGRDPSEFPVFQSKIATRKSKMKTAVSPVHLSPAVPLILANTLRDEGLRERASLGMLCQGAVNYRRRQSLIFY